MLNYLKIFFLFFFICPSISYAKTSVFVGGYIFPPFVDKDQQGNPTGLTLDFIDALNAIQNDYQFEFKFTSSKRRYTDFQRRQFDYLFFENTQWGWSDKPVNASNVFLEGGEKYIALKSPEKDQNYFDDLKQKSIVGILGYHYGFADYVSDQKQLKERFKIRLTPNHQASIEMVLKGLVDVGVVTESFLAQYMKNHPEVEDKLLVSDRYDQEYQHTILARVDSKPSIADINDYISKLQASDKLNELWAHYGINDD